MKLAKPIVHIPFESLKELSGRFMSVAKWINTLLSFLGLCAPKAQVSKARLANKSGLRLKKKMFKCCH